MNAAAIFLLFLFTALSGFFTHAFYGERAYVWSAVTCGATAGGMFLIGMMGPALLAGLAE